jgi:hypothetical protein
VAGGPPGCRQTRPAFDDQPDVGARAAHGNDSVVVRP